MAAAYRVVIQGWSKSEAIDEMVSGGYGFHGVWRHLPRYIESLDVQKVKSRIQKKSVDSAKSPQSVSLSDDTADETR
jgi:hypothetical protein